MELGIIYSMKVYYNNKEAKTKKRSKLHINECVVCKKEFSTYRNSKKTCGAECYKKIAHPKRTGENRNCLKCGKEFYCKPSEDRRGYKRKYCSVQCRRKYSDRPKGLYISSDGYWCLSSGKKLHRDIYEKHHQVKLSSKDIIHHINENKLDNNIKNLQKVNRSEHNRIHKFLTK